MARIIEFDDLDNRLRKAARALPIGIAKGMNKGFKQALRLSVTKYMVGGGRSAPPLPPPGPLRIRTGNLRRTVAVFPSRVSGSDVVIGGLKAGGATVAYAPVHEFGGSRIQARPYLEPALRDAIPDILREAAKGAAREINKFLEVS